VVRVSMKSRRWIAVAGAAVAVAAGTGALLLAGGSSAQAPVTLTVMTDVARFRDVNVPGRSAVGNYFVGRRVLVNETGESELGTMVEQCMEVHNSREVCDAVFTLKGRGRLITRGILLRHPGPVIAFAVTGGTGEFAAARGVARFADQGDGRYVITFELVP
jgi:hypothetical protein